jgi:flagellar assembly factor FliW
MGLPEPLTAAWGPAVMSRAYCLRMPVGRPAFPGPLPGTPISRLASLPDLFFGLAKWIAHVAYYVAARLAGHSGEVSMKLDTTRFGSIDVDDDSVITFTQPIIGFQEYRRFILMPGPGNGVTWLQSVDSADLAFILMNPRQIMSDYEVVLPQRELTELAVTAADELEVYTIVVVPEDRSQVRTNLRAPILISTKHRLGKQTILERSNYPIQFFLAKEKADQGSAQEAANARSDA